MADRPPLPPFDRETAAKKVQAAEDAWNTRDPEKVAGAYTEDSVWRNRDTFVTGRAEIVKFLAAKWDRELDYALRKELWAFHAGAGVNAPPSTYMVGGKQYIVVGAGGNTQIDFRRGNNIIAFSLN